MLKHAKHFFGFAAALAALLFVVSIFVQPERITDASWIDNRDRNALSVLNEPENSIDVLVLGDSESFTSISPYRLWEKQKITSYVCGQTGQQISEAYYLMKRAFQNNGRIWLSWRPMNFLPTQIWWKSCGWPLRRPENIMFRCFPITTVGKTCSFLQRRL